MRNLSNPVVRTKIARKLGNLGFDSPDFIDATDFLWKLERGYFATDSLKGCLPAENYERGLKILLSVAR